LIVDKSSPVSLYAVIVEGTIIFQDGLGDLEFHTFYFIIRKGALIIGTEQNPF